MRTTRPRSSNAATEQPTFGLGMWRSERYGRSGVNVASIVISAMPSAIAIVRSYRSRS